MSDKGAPVGAVGLDAGRWRALRKAALQALAKRDLPRRPPTGIEAAAPFPLCSAPTVRPGPVFVLYYRQLVDLPSIRRPESAVPGDPVDVPITIGCVPGTTAVHVGLSLQFEQRWNLLALEIGDLASTMGLAPSEQLTIEVVTSQRKLLEQTVVDSSEVSPVSGSFITSLPMPPIISSATRSATPAQMSTTLL